MSNGTDKNPSVEVFIVLFSSRDGVSKALLMPRIRMDTPKQSA
jgi:hypothetical protein